ncbi:hypothetical protein YC2023_121790 [Brassica napus]
MEASWIDKGSRKMASSTIWQILGRNDLDRSIPVNGFPIHIIENRQGSQGSLVRFLNYILFGIYLMIVLGGLCCIHHLVAPYLLGLFDWVRNLGGTIKC